MTLTPELLAELQQVDSDWRLIPCDGLKRPVDPATGDMKTDWSHHTYDADGIAELADSSFVKAVGLVLGEASGVIAVDFDGTGAVAMFKQVYGRIWSDLPPTVAWSSGVINRRQMAFRVPADLWPHLRGRRVWHNDAGRIVLELRGTGHQLLSSYLAAPKVSTSAIDSIADPGSRSRRGLLALSADLRASPGGSS